MLEFFDVLIKIFLLLVCKGWLDCGWIIWVGGWELIGGLEGYWVVWVIEELVILLEIDWVLLLVGVLEELWIVFEIVWIFVRGIRRILSFWRVNIMRIYMGFIINRGVGWVILRRVRNINILRIRVVFSKIIFLFIEMIFVLKRLIY